MKAWMGKHLAWIGGIATLALILGVVGVILYGYQAMPEPGWVGVPDKKFWDYLELLIGPAVLAIGVAWLNWALRQREARKEALPAEAEAHRKREAAKAEATQQARREREREAAEEARRERELEVENQRAQDAALQAYLDQMGQLLLDKDKPLRESEEGDEVRTLARARTLTVLTRLGKGRRKRSVLQFLYETDLITKDQAVVNLRGADLRGADLLEADLRGADLREANMSGIKGITNKELERQAKFLKGATMPNGQKYEEWLKSKGRGEER